LHATLEAIRSVPGVAEVYRAEELQDRPATQSAIRNAEANSYFAGRSGDLLIVRNPTGWFQARPRVSLAFRHRTRHSLQTMINTSPFF